MTAPAPDHDCLRDKQHLKGTSSILRASTTLPFVDPSATSLRDAAFWLYVRQALYNSTISQEPLDIDFSLELMPTPDLLVDTHPLAWLRSETAWANQLLWLTAYVANFCFSGPKVTDDATTRAAAWQELWDKIRPGRRAGRRHSIRLGKDQRRMSMCLRKCGSRRTGMVCLLSDFAREDGCAD